MEKEVKINNCPLCGHSVFVDERYLAGDDAPPYYDITCNCGLNLGLTNQFISEQEVVRKWNRLCAK